MRCPYCAEEIKDEAIFCRYCRHDLTFYKLISPLQERVSSLEESLTEVSADLEETKASLEELRPGSSVATVTSQPTSATGRGILPVAKDHLPLRTRVLIVVLVNLIFSSYLLLTVHFIIGSPLFSGLLLLLSLAAPVVGGAWVGTTWRGRHLRSYILLGIMSGLIPTAIIIWLTSATSDLAYLGIYLGIRPLTVMVKVLTSSVFSTTLLFVTGGLLGDQIEKRKSKPVKSERDAETREQVKATSRRITGSDEGSFYKTTVEILKFLQPFAPVITGLLGIIGPILLFLLNIQ